MKVLSVFLAFVLCFSLCVCAVAAEDDAVPSCDIQLKSVTSEELVVTLILKNCVNMKNFDGSLLYDTALLEYDDYWRGDDLVGISNLERKNNHLNVSVLAEEFDKGNLYLGIIFREHLLSSAEYKAIAEQYNMKVNVNGENCKILDLHFKLKDVNIRNLNFTVNDVSSNLKGFENKDITVKVFDHDHDFSGGWQVILKATCTYEGREKAVCKICKWENERVINKLDHEYSEEFTIDREPNCVYPGEQSRHCLYCEARNEVTSVSPRHIYEDWHILEDASSEKSVTIMSDCRGTPVILNGCPYYSVKVFDIEKMVSKWVSHDISPAVDGVKVTAGMEAGYFLEFVTEGARIIDTEGNVVPDASILASGMSVALSYEGFDYAFIPVIIKGDADGDGAISASDARTALRASVGLESLSLWQTKAADADNSEKIDASDARLILRASVGLERTESWI